MKIEVYSVIIDGYDPPRNDVRVFTGRDLFVDSKREAGMYFAIPHKFLDTDVSVMLSGEIYLVTPVEEYVKELLGDADMAIHQHYCRNCVYDEGAAIIKERRDYTEIIEEQLDAYSKEGYPRNSGMFETGIIIRRHNKIVESFNNAWFVEMCRYSRRDQMSLNYVLSKFPELKVNVIQEDVRLSRHLVHKKHNRVARV
jgi:hypothetical protein